MTDRPIIFSRDMVVELLADRKTQTRRLATSPLRRAAPGDRLWVRERYQRGLGSQVIYEADQPADAVDPQPWTAAMLLPRALSRLILFVSEVRFPARPRHHHGRCGGRGRGSARSGWGTTDARAGAGASGRDAGAIRRAVEPVARCRQVGG